MLDPFRIGVFSVIDLRAFSSIPYYIVKTLQAMPGVQIVSLPAGQPYCPPLFKRIRKRLERSLIGREYLWEKEPARCEYISRCLDAAIAAHPVDAVLLFGSEGCAYSETNTPLHCYSDSVFGSRLDLYPDQATAALGPATIREGIAVQQRAIDRLKKLFLSSRWALDQALARFSYRGLKEKCSVVGIGANLPGPALAESQTVIARASPVHFYWLGSYWERKGGEFAIDVVSSLRRSGIDSVLDVVGPVQPHRSFPWLHLHGKLTYEHPDQARQLMRISRNAIALLLPTSGDTTPLVISEAFSHGRPAITTPVGGIPEMVEDAKTGLLLPLDSPEHWTTRIGEAVATGALAQMEDACRRAFEETFNWGRVCAKMVRLMREG